MRNIPANLQARIDMESLSLARLWTATRADGVTVRLTDVDIDVMVGGNTFSCLPGFESSSLLSGLEDLGQEATITLPLSQTAFTVIDISLGRWRGAETTLQLVDYKDPSAGLVTLFRGKISSTTFDDTGALEVQVESRLDSNRVFDVESYSQSCRADLGDARCQVDVEALSKSFTVTGTVSGVQFKTQELDQIDNFWVYGVVQLVTGDNAGIAYEVATNRQFDKSVLLFQPTSFALTVGDTGVIYPGCDKTTNTCFVRYNNIANFRGEPHRVNRSRIDTTAP